ncbi:MAG: oxidoreductase, partial [Flammeovirgaceae bacterium]|nr:oxidoreductase [Flammeovirgaceae bacterium]
MKNILIIGGSSGIGASLAKKFANDPNYQVIATFNQGNIPTSENIKTFNFDVLSDTLDLSVLPGAIDGVVYCPGSINLLPFH